MKIIKIFTMIIFIGIIIVPLITFNFKSNIISEIDNRKLVENPFSEEMLNNGNTLAKNIKDYVNDRIGFRDEMILAYTILNDKLFGKMVHPSYTYGKNDYVFGMGLTTKEDKYSDFHETFAGFIKKISDYCTDRGVPFLFVFNPAKASVLREYVPDGINYDNTWVDKFLNTLNEKGVSYLDNREILIEKKDDGEVVFNKMYDANHWNDLGAYYGTNAILDKLQKNFFQKLELNNINDFKVSQILQTSLPVSKFPINEMVPNIEINFDNRVEEVNGYYDEIELDKIYRRFGYYKNYDKQKKGMPKVLTFQGSYMNQFGYKYLINAFSEYIYVHDYQNILNFPYYYNIFKPDCVIFEVAEYTFSNAYFDYELMKSFDINPTINSINLDKVSVVKNKLDLSHIAIEEGNKLKKIHYNTEIKDKYAWLFIGEDEYDMLKTDTGYEVTILKELYDKNMDIRILTFDGSILNIYD